MTISHRTKGKDYNSRYPLFILILLILPIMFLSACAALNGQPAHPPELNQEVITMQKLYFTPDVITQYNAKKLQPEQKIYRNQVLNGRIYVIDYYYSEFVKKVHGERAGMSIVADIAVLGANAAGLISSTKQLKDIFLAISGGLTGAKLSFDKNAYYEQTMPALVTKMDSLRKQQLLTIRTKMQKGTDKYGLTEGLVDINDYFQAGTVTGAIIGVQESAGASAQKAKKELKELTITSKFEFDANGKILTSLLRSGPKGAVNASFKEKLEKWMKENKVDTSITFFLNSEKLKEERKKAVQKLVIDQNQSE